jgi:hypothetical protein
MSEPDTAENLQALLDELAPLLVDGSPHAVALGHFLITPTGSDPAD